MTIETEDRAFVSLLSGKLSEALDYLRLPYFSKLFPARATAAAWLDDYVSKNETLPTKKIFRRKFPDLHLTQKPEPLDFCMDELREELIRETAVNANNKASELYDADDLKGFHELMQEMCDQIAEYEAPIREAVYYTEDYVTDQQAKLDENPEGIEMLPTGIKPYDDEYGGLEPGVILTISALVNLGKTYLACHMAEAARREGKNVLFYSLEMPKDKIAERLYCVRYKLDADQFARHKQPEASRLKGETRVEWWQSCLDHLKNKISKDKGDYGEVIIREAGESAITPRMISGDIQRFNAGAVIIDAAQDLRDNHLLRERTPGLYRALAELNGVCMRHNVPCTLLVQLDPEVERRGLTKGNLTRIQWGQVFAQKSGAVITMVGDRTSPQRELCVDKSRDGSVGRRFEGHFHFPHVELEFVEIQAVNISFDDEEVEEDVDAMEEAIKKAEKEYEMGMSRRSKRGERNPPPRSSSRGTNGPPPRRKDQPRSSGSDGEDEQDKQSPKKSSKSLGGRPLKSRGFRKKS